MKPVIRSSFIQEALHHPIDDYLKYRQTSNIRRALLDNKGVDHSDVVGASPVGVAPPTS